MNSKNVIFKFLAVFVAIGGAIASIGATSAGAHLKYQTSTGRIVCSTVASPNPCGIAGGNTCQVTLGIDGTPTTVTAWQHGCAVRITTTQPSPFAFNVNKDLPDDAQILN